MSDIKVDYSDYRRQMETARERLERWLTTPEAPPAFVHALERVNACLEATAERDGQELAVEPLAEPPASSS